MAYKNKLDERRYQKKYRRTHRKRLKKLKKVYYRKNRSRIKEYRRARRKDISEYNKSYHTAHRAELLPKMRVRTRQWLKRPDVRSHRKFWSRGWRKTHPGVNGQANRKSRARLKRMVIARMGGKCKCCGEKEIEFLTIDHVLEDGARHRKRLKLGGGSIHRYIRDHNYPKRRFQILCANCNMSKRIGRGGCIHKRRHS